jgi:hypothetical protein
MHFNLFNFKNTQAHYYVLIVLLGLSFYHFESYADVLPAPQSQTILTIKGKIGNTNSKDNNKKVYFDREMLNNLPQRRIATTTRWTQGKQVFEGVGIQDLMNYVGAQGKNLKAVALDGYITPIIALKDLKRYGVILATKKNGKTLKIRDKGPIWMMYPIDEHQELKNDVLIQYKLIWHLRTLIIE